MKFKLIGILAMLLSGCQAKTPLQPQPDGYRRYQRIETTKHTGHAVLHIQPDGGARVVYPSGYVRSFQKGERIVVELGRP